MAIPDYRLSTVLSGHSMDVRAVASKEYCILSASRDRTAKLWHPEGVKDYANIVTYKGHKNFVSCIGWLPPCERFPEGLVVTGSNDNTILGYNLHDGVVQITLEGHDNTVCCVAAGYDSGILLSSSWDCTARIWNMNNPNNIAKTLKGHQAAIWSVLELGNKELYATASADKTIILWNKDGVKHKSLTGHTDCVRALVVASPETFLSCGNDASIRLWKNSGECLNTYYGHTNYIYSISMSPADGSTFATSGEDGSVRLWKNGECVRELQLPAQSVWSVAIVENGDVVTGSSDGLIRVFTAEPGRYAAAAALAAFDAEVERAQAAARQELGGYKLSELPGPEALLAPGKTDGQTKLVRRGTAVKCYQWSAAAGEWTEVGDVMGAKGPTEGKTMHQGKEYDFVFSVDIKDGAPPLKLPFNKGEDPWVSAQTFIHSNDLPQVYLEQVANFIITNAKLDTLPPADNNGMADPFTGESRYVPAAPAAPAAPTAAAPIVACDTYIRFDQANHKAIADKLAEFNARAGDGPALPAARLQAVVKLAEMNDDYNEDDVVLLKKILQWPKEILFPALDVARLAVRRPRVNASLFDAEHGPLFVTYLIDLLAPDNLPANQLLALRVLTNAFAALAGEMAVIAAAERVAHALLCLTQLGGNAQIAAMSLLVNLSVALAAQPDAAALADAAVALLARATDREAHFRGLVALATLLAESPNKLAIQAKIVSNTQLHNRLKQDCVNVNSSDPTLKKIANYSQQISSLL